MVVEQRIERDEMGDVSVPDNALYGAQTQRAVGNFPISSLRFGHECFKPDGVNLLALDDQGITGRLIEDLGDRRWHLGQDRAEPRHVYA